MHRSYGCKHDAAMFEVVLKEYCKFETELGLLGDLMIDTACLDIPKVPPPPVHRVECRHSPLI